MKKFIVALTFFSVAYTAKCQSFTQSNEPQIGQSATMYVCDSSMSSMASQTGANVTWNFANLQGYNGLTNMITVIDPSVSTFFSSTFASSTKAISYENTITTFLSSSATERLLHGFVYADPNLGNVIANYSQDNEILASYPFAFQGSVSDIFSGNLQYTLGVTQSPACSGSSKAMVDGTGTLILAGTTFPNVIRYTVSDTVSATTILGLVSVIHTQFEYYDLANNTLPLFVHTTITIKQGSNTMVDRSIVLSSVQPSQNVGIIEVNNALFSVSPNPTNDNIQVNGNFSGNLNGEILDQVGRKVMNVTVQSGDFINLSTLNPGIYSLVLNDGKSKTTKRILLK